MKIFFCCKSHGNDNPDEVNETKPERDFSVKQLKGKHDDLIVRMEKPYMYLKEIPFDFFAYQVIEFTNLNATIAYDSRKHTYLSCHSSKYYEKFPNDLFQSFIENKIMKKEPLYKKFSKEETNGVIFKEILLLSHKGLVLRMEKAFPDARPEEKGFKKCDAIAIGLLYCKGRNDDKFKFFYELFQKDGRFSPCPELDSFLGSLFFLASYCMIDSRFRLTKKFPTIFNIIEKAVISTIIDAYEVQDIVRLVNIYNSYLFPEGKKSYIYSELKEHFIKQNLGWIFYPRTIRYQLEVNNDIK